ncbi:unnamed protein product, partial [Prorocentrum cordatum]
PPAAGPRQPGAPPPPGAGVPRWGCRSGPGDDLPRCVGVPHPSQRLRGELLRSICAHLGEGKGRPSRTSSSRRSRGFQGA